MFDTLNNEGFAVLVAVAVFVFFAGQTWILLGREVPSWVATVTGVAAAVLAVSALFALF